MSQTSGPNDAMFFVVARENRAACNYYNGKRREQRLRRRAAWFPLQRISVGQLADGRLEHDLR